MKLYMHKFFGFLSDEILIFVCSCVLNLTMSPTRSISIWNLINSITCELHVRYLIVLCTFDFYNQVDVFSHFNASHKDLQIELESFVKLK
jgi:hypothetical protein